MFRAGRNSWQMFGEGEGHLAVYCVALGKLWWFRGRANMTMPITVKDACTSHLARTKYFMTFHVVQISRETRFEFEMLCFLQFPYMPNT
jgi:hypothetical protein